MAYTLVVSVRRTSAPTVTYAAASAPPTRARMSPSSARGSIDRSTPDSTTAPAMATQMPAHAPRGPTEAAPPALAPSGAGFFEDPYPQPARAGGRAPAHRTSNGPMVFGYDE